MVNVTRDWVPFDFRLAALQLPVGCQLKDGSKTTLLEEIDEQFLSDNGFISPDDIDYIYSIDFSSDIRNYGDGVRYYSYSKQSSDVEYLRMNRLRHAWAVAKGFELQYGGFTCMTFKVV